MAVPASVRPYPLATGMPRVVEKLQRLRFGERAADDDGLEFAAECGVNLFQKTAAEPETRVAFG